MKSNADLQKDVQDAIKWEPLLHAAEIGVTAKDGIVTLTGTVDSYFKKREAENAAKNVLGVKVVVEKIEVVLISRWATKTDNDIASEIVNAFKWNRQVPDEKVQVKVEKGWITLEGELNWNYERVAAYDAVKHIMGVVGVHNKITIQSETHDAVEKGLVERAIARNWSINDCDIRVGVSGTLVTLTGSVRSLYERDEAARVAWNAPGIRMVHNEIVVDHNYAMAV
jgi:osmotically-inducible protein OsmY